MKNAKITLIVITILFLGFFFFNTSKANADTLYFNGAVDHNWNTLGNWWTGSPGGTPAVSLPGASDDVIVSSLITSNSGPAASVSTLTVSGTAQIANIIITVANGATFNDSSFLFAGSIHGNTTFNGTSSTYSVSITGNVTFNGSSRYDHGGTITGNVTFNSSSYDNGGTITGNVAFNGSSYKSSTSDVIIGNITFDASSRNLGTITGNPIFNGASRNLGTITGNPTFSLLSQNTGTGIITSSPTFNGDLSENYGTVSGTKTRRYTSDITPTRNFVNDGPWTILADGAHVNLSLATIDKDPSSPTYTTLQTANGGSFVNPPTLTTDPVTSMTQNSATLNGTITDTGGENPTTRFEYGLTDAYGTATSESAPLGAGPFSNNISSLTCGTLYHYKAYATNSAGTGNGGDQTFTTSACPIYHSSGGYSRAGATAFVPPPTTPPIIPPTNPTSPTLPTTPAYTPPILPPNSPPIFCQNGMSLESNCTTVIFIPTSIQSLKLGLSDPIIQTLQEYLNTHGFTVALTGPGSPGYETKYFGPKTQKALMSFQKAHNLVEDGILGPITTGEMK